jgi:hypothetical protein
LQRERNPHAKNQPVRSKKGNSKTKAKIGSQAGREIEETESRDEKGGSNRRITGCRHPGVAD